MKPHVSIIWTYRHQGSGWTICYVNPYGLKLIMHSYYCHCIIMCIIWFLAWSIIYYCIVLWRACEYFCNCLLAPDMCFFNLFLWMSLRSDESCDKNWIWPEMFEIVFSNLLPVQYQFKHFVIKMWESENPVTTNTC